MQASCWEHPEDYCQRKPLRIIQSNNYHHHAGVLSPRLWWRVVLPLRMLRVSMHEVFTMIVNNIIVMEGISWRAAGTWPGEVCLHVRKSCTEEAERFMSNHLKGKSFPFNHIRLLHIFKHYCYSICVDCGFQLISNLICFKLVTI